MFLRRVAWLMISFSALVSQAAGITATAHGDDEKFSASLNSSSATSDAQYPLIQCGCGGPQYRQAFQEFETGRRLAAAGDASSVDYFFQSAMRSWSDLTEGFAEQPSRLRIGTLNLYNSAVLSCVIAGQAYGRLDVQTGLKVSYEGAWQTIPVINRGLPWELHQFDQFLTANRSLQNPDFQPTARGGVGAPLIGIHLRRTRQSDAMRFLPKHPFPVTAVLRRLEPVQNAGPNPLAGICLELHNPVQSRQLQLKCCQVPLAGNSEASLAFAMEQLELNANAWTAFFRPEEEVNHVGMLLLEPYQPNKIPIVMVHGLISNPATWGTLVNQLQQEPELMEKYQIWFFFYETSNPYLESAARLRKSLQNTLAELDPNQTDPALQNLVLMGHSMGGLLSRLQVTWSGQHLWNQFSKVPFNQIQVKPGFRRILAEAFFFRPEPRIKRVVFMATPHQGSSMSYRLVGCIGNLLAGRLPTLQEGYSELRRQNPGIFQAGIARRLPTSIQGLRPGSPGLTGLAKLPFSADVHLHSVVGTGGCRPCLSGDGVVPVTSARLSGVESELFVDALHTGVHTHPRSVHEVKRILAIHWNEYTARLARSGTN